MTAYSNTQKSTNISVSASLVVLILVNCIPILGVIYFNWSAIDIIYLYWVETLIIGIFNVFKIAFAGSNAAIGPKLFLVPFFMLHFSIFILVQGVFILNLDSGNAEKISKIKDITDIFRVIDLTTIFLPLLFPIISIFTSHLFSFFYNYLYRREFEKTNEVKLMFYPYKRIFLQQLVAIFGTVVVSNMSNGKIIVMIFVIVFKTLADAFTHRAMHRSRIKKDDFLLQDSTEMLNSKKK